MICELEDKIFNVGTDSFETTALEVFHWQYAQNQLYRSFCEALSKKPAQINAIHKIPFIPVSFFKQHEVRSGRWVPEVVFESSGTTQTGNSRHFVQSLELYQRSFEAAFELFYGDPSGWCILGLLPSYLERQNSSLVLMVDRLIKKSGHPSGGFFLNNVSELLGVIAQNEAVGQKTLVIGVTFALLDLAENHKLDLHHTVIMETGGMKGRREEITREDLHDRLRRSFGVSSIHSEYGMTELLSQAYSSGEGLFGCPPWMKILLREEDDPMTTIQQSGEQTGLVNIIDLANLYSCAFIAVDDIGRLHPDNRFEILGRMDSSDVRGCSLMYVG